MFYVLLNNYNLLAKILILLGFCKYFLDYFLLFYIYKTSTYHLSYLYNLNKCPFCYNKGSLFRNKGSLLMNKCRLSVNKELQAVHFLAHYLFPRWECFIPRLGMFCSQRGNNSVPTDCLVDDL